MLRGTVENSCGAPGAARTMGDMRVRLLRRLRDERGDVPGWVLITLMTAGLVILIWGIAGPALGNVFETALSRVTGF
jgi:hypothetical protein